MKASECWWGEIHGADDLVEALRHDGIEVRDFVSYEDLSEIYRRTKTLVVAAELHGGGERAVLEARACGATVLLVGDNPKLHDVMTGPIYDHEYYAQQLMKGIEEASARGRVRASRARSIRRLLGDRIRGLPGLVRLNTRRLSKATRRVRRLPR